MEEKDDKYVSNTDLYKGVGTFLLVVFLIIGIAFITDLNNVFLGTTFIISGISIKIVLLIAYSICYRLDTLINKKK